MFNNKMSALKYMLFALVLWTVLLHCVSGTSNPNDCASQEELDAVERKVDELYSQLHYWQNVTINILKEQYFPSNPGPVSECSDLGTLESAVLNNITQSNKDIHEKLCMMDGKLETHMEVTNEKLESLEEEHRTQHQNITEILQSSVLNITQSNREIYRILQAGNLEIMDEMESMSEHVEVMSEQLESLVQQHTTDGNITTGSFDNPAHNCSHIKHNHPNSYSGYYWLQRSPGYAVKVYCDMERVCGCAVGRGESGVWMRVADIDMTRPKESCPSGFRKITSSGKTMCGGQSRTCTSTKFTSHRVPYSRVCGRIIGYQFGKTNAFDEYNDHSSTSIDTYFLDGIVLTYGSPRCHIWTFAAGFSQYERGSHGCPCNNGFSEAVPPYIENDYFCDSGHQYNTDPPFTYLTSDPLWDGSGCVRGSCCQFNSPLWFCKDLPEYTTEDIELRLCLDEGNGNEDTPFEVVELYVQ